MSARNKYRYNRAPRRHHVRRLVFLVVALIIFGAIIGVVAWDLKKHSGNSSVTGKEREVSQIEAESVKQLQVNEPFFSMELPGDWKEMRRYKSANENSIEWHATTKGEDNRYLTVYIDTIPLKKAVNRLLPVKAEDNTLSYGELSDNCASFTGLKSPELNRANLQVETPAKWQNVDFICNLPQAVQNVTGTGSVGSQNSVTVVGPLQGSHKYFFLYDDKNIQPKSSILADAIRSFRAK
jgi:hypothetical protein